MTDMQVPDLAAVAAFYDSTEALEILMGENIHFGYWPEDQPGLTITEAQHLLTDLVIKGTGADEGSRVLDIGCGTGGPACRAAQTTGASITGITISSRQLEAAKARSARRGLGAAADFQLTDATAMPFPSRSFDACYAIESILHIPDKAQALAEAYRVLRPGGKLSIADITRNEGQDLDDPGPGVSVLDTMACISPDQYQRLLAKAGFRIDGIREVNEHTRRTYGELVEHIVAVHGELVDASDVAYVDAIDALTRMLDYASANGSIGYVLITATKPSA